MPRPDQMQVTIFKLSASVAVLMGLLHTSGKFTETEIDELMEHAMESAALGWPRKE